MKTFIIILDKLRVTTKKMTSVYHKIEEILVPEFHKIKFGKKNANNISMFV